MTWNYRVIRHVDGHGRTWYGIHEVYYNENGEMDSVTEDHVRPAADSIEELKRDLELMLEAFSKPILHYDNL